MHAHTRARAHTYTENHKMQQGVLHKNYHCVYIIRFCCYFVAELPDKPILLPQFVESRHCIAYHLTRKGRNVADRVVCVLGYAHPEITFSPAIYPVTAILLHYMTGRLQLLYENT